MIIIFNISVIIFQCKIPFKIVLQPLIIIYYCYQIKLSNSNYRRMQRFNPKRVPADFLQALKNTPQVPSKSQNKSKQNVNPIAKHATMPRQIPTKTQTVTKGSQNTTQNVQKSRSRIKQDDFTKISQSYVLDGNCLKKYQGKSIKVISNRMGNQKQNISSVHAQCNEQIPIGLVSFQQKVKLEYLEEKGFLKPQQKIRLQKARKQKQFPLQPIKGKTVSTRQQQERQIKKRQYTQSQQMYPYYEQGPLEQEEGQYQNQYYPASHYNRSAHAYPCDYGSTYGHEVGVKSQHKRQPMISMTASNKLNRGQQKYRSARVKYHKQPTHSQLRQKGSQIMARAPRRLEAQYPQPWYQQDLQYDQHDQEEFSNRHGVVPDVNLTHMSMKANQKVYRNKQFYDNHYCCPPHYGQSTKQRRSEQFSQPKKQASHSHATKDKIHPYRHSNHHSKKNNYSAFFQNPHNYWEDNYNKSYY